MTTPIGLAINIAKLGPFHRQGYQLVEDGDHFLHLYWHDETVAHFSQQGVTIPEIIKTCCEHSEKVVKEGRA
jgi:hypothetical protein